MLKATDYEILRGVKANGLTKISLERQPVRVATLLDKKTFNEDQYLIHHKPVFLEDPVYDWDWRCFANGRPTDHAGAGCLRAAETQRTANRLAARQVRHLGLRKNMANLILIGPQNVGKSTTAQWVVHLARVGRLSLDDRRQSWYPDNQAVFKEAWSILSS